MSYDSLDSVAVLISTVSSLIASLVFMIVGIVCYIVLAACNARMFRSAGQPGWKAWIPFVNTWTLYELAFGAGFGWIMLLTFLGFIPFIGGLISCVISVYQSYLYARAFGQGTVSTVLYILFTPIMLMIWVITGSYQYLGPQPNIFNKNIRKM